MSKSARADEPAVKMSLVLYRSDLDSLRTLQKLATYKPKSPTIRSAIRFCASVVALKKRAESSGKHLKLVAEDDHGNTETYMEILDLAL